MTVFRYSAQLVEEARRVSMLVLFNHVQAQASLKAFVAKVRRESAPFPKVDLSVYYAAYDLDPTAAREFYAASIAGNARRYGLMMPQLVMAAFAMAEVTEQASVPGSTLDALIAAHDHHIIWKNGGWNGSEPTYLVTKFPMNFPPSAIEVWWPLIRYYDAPVITRLSDGSWQDHSRGDTGIHPCTGRAHGRGLILKQGL